MNKLNKKCLICGNKFEIAYCRKNTAKYCSCKCQHQSMRNKPNTKLSQKIEKYCVICNKKFKVSPSLIKIQCCSKKCGDIKGTLTRKLKKVNIGLKRTTKQKKLISITTKKAMKKPEIIEKISKTWFKKGKHASQNTEFKKGHYWDIKTEQKRISNSIKGNKRKTKPEKEVELLLKLLFPNKYKFVGDGKIMIESFNPDFINKKDKKIIEVFGEYWHTIPKRKRNDYIRFKVYKKHGYKTLVIWDYELKNKLKLKRKLNEFNT